MTAPTENRESLVAELGCGPKTSWALVVLLDALMDAGSAGLDVTLVRVPQWVLACAVAVDRGLVEAVPGHPPLRPAWIPPATLCLPSSHLRLTAATRDRLTIAAHA